MYGDHIGTLTATIYRPDSQTRLPLGQPGSKGQQWNSYHLDIDELGFKAKVSIQRELRYHSDARSWVFDIPCELQWISNVESLHYHS